MSISGHNAYAQQPEHSANQETLQQDTLRPLTRKEQRAERKRLKNTPLDLPELNRTSYRVSGGARTEAKADALATHVADSVVMHQDSLALAIAPELQPGDPIISPVDSLMNAGMAEGSDSTFMMTGTVDGDTAFRLAGEYVGGDPEALSNREKKELRRKQFRADTTMYRHSPIFRDSISQGNLTLISLVTPGFAQLYNGDYWKIPVLYATTGTSLYFGIKQNQKFQKYKTEFNRLMAEDRYDRGKLDPVQSKMIQHNTWRQMFFIGAIGSYIYFIGDGLMNYPGQRDPIRIATTLSAICPGAGQIYNKSYWKLPFVFGGLASLIYVIDWNNRIYQVYKSAYEIVSNGGTPPTANTDATSLKNERDTARRSRDLSIILTGVVYLFNVMDAHVDAHMKDYDISDDLAWKLRLEPSVESLYTQTYGQSNSFGFRLSLTF